jgi:hypothetical protein
MTTTCRSITLFLLVLVLLDLAFPRALVFSLALVPALGLRRRALTVLATSRLRTVILRAGLWSGTLRSRPGFSRRPGLGTLGLRRAAIRACSFLRAILAPLHLRA